MTLSTLVSEFFSSASSFTMSVPEVHAEAPEEKEESEEGEDDKEEEKEGGDEPEEGGEEEEEEEEEEPEDIKPKLEEECANSKQCAPAKHHFDECVERVHEHEEKGEEKKGIHEDCVEEFFHLQHCATQCAAPKLFAALK